MIRLYIWCCNFISLLFSYTGPCFQKHLITFWKTMSADICVKHWLTVKTSVHSFLKSYFLLYSEKETIRCWHSSCCSYVMHIQKKKGALSVIKSNADKFLTCLLATDVALTAMSFSRSWPLESDMARFLISNLNSTPWKIRITIERCIIFLRFVTIRKPWTYTSILYTLVFLVKTSIVELPNGR